MQLTLPGKNGIIITVCVRMCLIAVIDRAKRIDCAAFSQGGTGWWSPSHGLLPALWQTGQEQSGICGPS